MSNGTSWQPSLTSSLQQTLTNLENSSYVGSQVNKAASTMYTSAVNASLPFIDQEGILNSQVSALQSLQSDLQTLQSAIQTLGAQQTWNSVTATSSNTNALTITASSGAPLTSVAYTVTQLAQGQISTLSGLSAASPSTAAATQNGSLTITVGSTPTTISISSGDSLDTIAQNINSQSSTTNVQASVVPYNNSGTTNYELMLTSTQIGAKAGAFSVSTTIGATENDVQSAQDAQITLGSGATGVPITSSTNTFTNALPNTTVTAVSTGSGTISIKANPDAVTSAMKSFFNAYNAVEKLVYNGGSAADTTIGQLIAGQLPTAIGQQVSTDTVSPTDAQITSLSQIGVMLTPGSYSLSNGSFSSSGNPTLGWESSSGVGGVSLPSGVTLQDGQTTFNNLVTTNAADLQKFLGVSSTGLNLPSGSFLSQFSSQVNLWLQDLGGGNSNGTDITGEIADLQNQIGTPGSGAQPGTINYSLNQLESQYTSQIQGLVSQWNAAQASIMMANNQMLNLQAMQNLTSSSYYQTGTMLGG